MHDNINDTAPRHSDPELVEGEESVYFGRRLRRLLNFDFLSLIFNFKNARRHFCKTNPISKPKKPRYDAKNAEMEAKKVGKKTKRTQFYAMEASEMIPSINSATV